MGVLAAALAAVVRALLSLVVLFGLPSAVIAQPSFTPIRINAGGPGYTGSLGQPWTADQFFTGGSTFATSLPIAGSTDDPLYRDARFGNFAYRVPVPNGTYEVVLHFAEIQGARTGQRIFDVAAEGTTVVDNLDIAALVGRRRSLVRTVSATVTDGVVDLVFTPVVGDATIAALEIRMPLQPAAGGERRRGSDHYVAGDGGLGGVGLR